MGRESSIHNAIIRYADHLVKLDFEELQNQLHSNRTKYEWNSLENIESGIGGYLLFLIEAYKTTGNGKYHKYIISICDELMRYVDEKDTLNYSFYTGRLGFVYVLIKLYEITADHQYLTNAIKIAEKIPSEYITSEYVRDSLYDGRAGSVLVLLNLYIVERNDGIMRLTEKLIEAIAGNGILTESGMSWGAKHEIGKKSSLSFAYGTAGIYFVLRQINSICRNKTIIEPLLKDIEYYQRSRLDHFSHEKRELQNDSVNNKELVAGKSFQTNGEDCLVSQSEVSWAYGISGIFGGIMRNDYVESYISVDRFENDFLHNGMAGAYISHGYVYNNLEAHLLDAIEKGVVDISGGLFHGNVGCTYALLKGLSNGQDKTGSILFPKLNIDRKRKIDINIESGKILKSLYFKEYPRTIEFFEQISPVSFFNHINRDRNDKQLEFIRLNQFLDSELSKNLDASTYELFEDLVRYEREKNSYQDLLSNSHERQISTDNRQREKALTYLNNSEEWLLKQTFILSKDLKFISSKWNWADISISVTQNMSEAPANWHTLFQYGADGVIETPMHIVGMILHSFAQPKPFHQILDELKNYCNHQSQDVLKVFSRNTGSIDVEDFINRLDYLVISKVKQFIYEGVLNFQGMNNKYGASTI